MARYLYSIYRSHYTGNRAQSAWFFYGSDKRIMMFWRGILTKNGTVLKNAKNIFNLKSI